MAVVCTGTLFQLYDKGGTPPAVFTVAWPPHFGAVAAARSPRPAAAPTYADLRDWLLAEPALRKAFTRRFAERKQDPAFRAALVENLARHPEWEPLLFPERFVKPASAPR